MAGPITQAVTELLPHRAPMLMIDRILAADNDSCTAIKNISHNEPCFAGHFPGNPIFPGVLTVEALAQACAVCLRRDGGGQLPIFAGINRARFLGMVRPGDQLRLSVRKTAERKGFYTFSALAEVDGQTVCEAELVVVLK